MKIHVFPRSAGKLFTWTTVMQLVEESKLALDVGINTYLHFQIPDTHSCPFTMAHLMTHTSGFEEQFATLLESALPASITNDQWKVKRGRDDGR